MTTDCQPLPPGAILLTGPVNCREGVCGDCPPFDGFYQTIPCGCSPYPQGSNTGIWIPCSCVNARQAAGDQCPVFRAFVNGTLVCVKPNLRNGPVASAEGIITCDYVRGGCCACCNGCASYQGTATTITWHNYQESQTNIPIPCCCNNAGADKRGSGGETRYWGVAGPCYGRMKRQYQWTGTQGPNGGVITWQSTECDCGVNPETGECECHCHADSGSIVLGAVTCDPFMIDPFGAPGAIKDGFMAYDCYRFRTQYTWGVADGDFGDYQATVSLSPASGICDTACGGGIIIGSSWGPGGGRSAPCSSCGGGGSRGIVL